MTGVTSTVILDRPLRVQDGQARLEVRCPWYRSMALSTVESLAVTVDGSAVSPDEVRLEVDGHLHALAELAGLWQQNWFVQDTATLHVPVAPLGRTAEVSVDLVLRIPYLSAGPGTPVRIPFTDSRVLGVDEGPP
jgi:hypothetical protein